MGHAMGAVRRAAPGDTVALAGLAKRFHAAAGLGWPFVPAYAEARFRSLIADPSATVIVWDDGGVQGVIAGALVPQVWHPVTYATELGWWVEPAARGRAWRPLLRAFETWAEDRGAAGVLMSALEERAAALIERAGYEPQSERHFLRVIR